MVKLANFQVNQIPQFFQIPDPSRLLHPKNLADSEDLRPLEIVYLSDCTCVLMFRFGKKKCSEMRPAWLLSLPGFFFRLLLHGRRRFATVRSSWPEAVLREMLRGRTDVSAQVLAVEAFQ